MIEFVEKPEEEVDPFEEYFEQNIVPLVEDENKIKSKYRSKFWGYLFSVLFLASANILVVLFFAQMRKTPISWEQLLLVNFFLFLLIFLPIRQYNKIQKNDIFDVFLKFYGNWKHLQNSQVKLVHSPIIPPHDEVGSTHNIMGTLDGATIEMRDTFYTGKSLFGKSVVSSGVVLYITFAQNFDGSLLMFDKGGFYRKNKFNGFEYCNGKIDIPSANYFNIFASNDEIKEKLLHSLFFENLLDLKDVFKARNIYVQAQDNFMRVYLEKSEFYINSYKFWSSKIDKNRFLQMHHEFETTYLFVQIVQSLMEEK